MKFFIHNLSIQFKKCQNFQTNKLREFMSVKISCIPQMPHIISSCRWIKVTEAMKNYKSSERILCKDTMFDSNSKNSWHNSFRRHVYFRKLPVTKTVPMIPQVMCDFYVMKDFLI